MMAEREMKYREIAEITGMHPNTISQLKNHPPKRMDFDTLDKLCRALRCQPGDLMTYIPGDDEND